MNKQIVITQSEPTVSIGVPVFNGEAFLADALDSILSQTFTDFEVIISDNASTDATEAICREYADQDPRIRYVRQSSNLGAAPNFNLLVPMARGRFFKWAAADDLMAPDFLAKCVDALEANPEASIATPITREIDVNGERIGDCPVDPDFGDPSTAKRFAALLPMRECYEVFGLIRMDMLRDTKLIIGSSHGDGVLLCALGTQGPFALVPEPLFISRHHESQSINLGTNRVDYSEWFDARNKGKLLMPYWRMFLEFSQVPFSYRMSLSERAACIRAVFAYAWRKRRALRADLKRAARRMLRPGSRALAST